MYSLLDILQLIIHYNYNIIKFSSYGLDFAEIAIFKPIGPLRDQWAFHLKYDATARTFKPLHF